MQKIIHRAHERGKTGTDWLESYHTFSFASYYDPQRMNFGKLRVLNDDTVKPGRGFELHPHRDMEIISIPLNGSLQHQDSQENSEIINTGSIQVMTAGKGIMHSEYNASENEEVTFLQVWIIPQDKSLEPKYEIRDFDFEKVDNDFLLLVSPDGEENTPKLNQHAWISYGRFQQDEMTVYPLKDKENGIYIFIKEGEINVDGDKLNRRDGIGLAGEAEVPLVFEKDSEFFIIEIPMQ